MTTIVIDDSTKDGRDLIEFLREKSSVRILDRAEEVDWWTSISDKERLAIEEGLSDIKSNETVSYDNIKERYAHWL